MGYHHRHFMAEVAAVEFISYEATLEKFQQEWLEIVKGTRRVPHITLLNTQPWW